MRACNKRGTLAASHLTTTFRIMMMLAKTALLGTLLGLSFRAFILVPAVVIDSAAVLSVGIARSDSIW